MAQTTFRKHGVEYRKPELSARQLEVTELAVDSRAVVYGAPGAGKTTALKELYLQLVKSGLKAHNVLAITASRDAANLLRDELAIANRGATAGPMARTLASFAFSILRQDALQTGTRSPELINGSEQDRILKQLLAEEVAAGRQAFVVCPRIDESESEEGDDVDVEPGIPMAAAETIAKNLSNVLVYIKINSTFGEN